ncbi:MAG: winged helix-turn-helix transcriptional regulator, partial [Polyangiaceae bacterium]
CLEKVTYSSRATRFEYRLTAKGRDALPAIALLNQWNRRRAHDPSARPALAHKCGARLELVAICAGCGRAIVARDVKALDFEPIAHSSKLAPPPKVRRGRNVLEARANGDRSGAPTITAEDCIGDRWASLVIGAMMFGLHRFSEIETAIAIAPNILSSRLQLLARARIIERRARAAGPATYHLTPKGTALFPAIMALCAWGDRWLRAPRKTEKKSPKKQAVSWGLLHRPCGEWLRTEVVCKPCGTELSGEDFR